MKNISTTDILFIIGRNIKKARELRGLTQEEVASTANIDRSYLSECESGTQNISVGILNRISIALDVDFSTFFAFENPLLAADTFDYSCIRDVPLPPYLKKEDIVNALQKTQKFFSTIRQASNINLASIIQGNNFSGIVSNVFTKILSESSLYKEFSEQRYPDLIGPENIGLEVKASVNPWKGGEGHNGHSGWHIIVCYMIKDCGDIEITQIEIAELIGFDKKDSDWKYLGSKRNTNNSQRTETYVTTNIGTAKLRDGTFFLRKDLVFISKSLLSHRKKIIELPIPKFSPFYQ